MTSQKTRTSFQIIAKLQAYIRTHDYVNGGWLPPGRKMAEDLGCSHLTYRKALKFLENERVAISFSTTGHYVVPEHLRSSKVGIIIGQSELLPYIPHDYSQSAEGYQSILSAVVDTLARGDFDIQLLQMPRPEQSLDLANVYYMKGLVWINPSPKIVELIQAFEVENPHIPVIIVTTGYIPALATRENAFIPYVSDIEKDRIADLLAKGHLKLMYMGDFAKIKKSGALSLFLSHDVTFSKDDCYQGGFMQDQEVIDRIQERGYTAIISNGGPNRLHFLFETLRKLPDDKKPVVSLFLESLYKKIMRKCPIILADYPEEKIHYMPEKPEPSHGVLAAKYLLHRMQELSKRN